MSVIEKELIAHTPAYLFVCPSCGFSALLTLKKALSHVKCKCQLSYLIRREGRSSYRKKVNILATYNGKQITIIDISTKGYCVSSPHELPTDGIIHYQLPNKRRSVITEKVRVVNSTNGRYGLLAEINPYSQAQKDKGFFLLP